VGEDHPSLVVEHQRQDYQRLKMFSLLPDTQKLYPTLELESDTNLDELPRITLDRELSESKDVYPSIAVGRFRPEAR